MPDGYDVLTWLHIGDLPIVRDRRLAAGASQNISGGGDRGAAWPKRGITGAQHGPNRNGRKG